MDQIVKRLWHKAGPARIPLGGAFELLPVCNLHCKMCYVRKSMAEVNQMGGLLPAEQWLEFARQASAEGLLFPLLTGGEPFLRKDFQEIFAKMQEMGLQVSINSNASLISESMAKWLGVHRPTRINITLYGASEESYESLCGDGDAFRRVHQAVQWLKENDVPVKFNTSVTPENVHDLEGIISYAHSVGSPIQVASYMFPPVRRDAGLIGQNHRLSPEEAGWARVHADYLQADRTWFMGQAEKFSHFVNLDELALDEGLVGKPQEMNCRAGRCTFWIDWQGYISNCGMYGSVRQRLIGRSFSEAWKMVVDGTSVMRYSPACNACPNCPLCHACIAMVYNECGDLNGRPEYLCKMNAASAKYYVEYAAKLQSGELPDLDPAAQPYEPDECII